MGVGLESDPESGVSKSAARKELPMDARIRLRYTTATAGQGARPTFVTEADHAGGLCRPLTPDL